MNWLRRLWGGRPALSDAQRARLQACIDTPRDDTATPLADARWVVVDVESSGLDVFSDRLIAIGAVRVQAQALPLAGSFYHVLRQAAPSSVENILVHGIGGTEQTAGLEPAEALLAFVEYAGGAPLVAYHADFDRAMINRATRAYLGVTLRNRWLDLAQIAPALFPEHAKNRRALDDWTTPLGIVNLNRHNAVADASATAQLLLVLLDRARAQGLQNVNDLLSLERGQRWLGR